MRLPKWYLRLEPAGCSVSILPSAGVLAKSFLVCKIYQPKPSARTIALRMIIKRNVFIRFSFTGGMGCLPDSPLP